MPEVQAIVVGPSIPDAGAPVCGTEGCSELATFSYVWAWGQSGKCCSVHAALLQQTSVQLDRTVQVTALVPTGPVPLTRDERSRLKGEAYALEAEIEELKARGLALYRENETLTRTAQAAITRGKETEARLKDALASVGELEVELQKRDAAHGDLVDEVSRLRTLTSFSQDTDHSRVDG